MSVPASHPNSAVAGTPHKCLTIEERYRAYEDRVHRRVDRLFLVLLGLQWLVGIIFAIVVSPRTWTGANSAVHPHVVAALVLGTLFCSLPMFLIWRLPGHVLTRHIVAIGQVGFSGLLIHLTGGRIETHFHVFGSLAFLACYRDWKVLPTATLIITLDHLIRGMWFPESVYGVSFSSPWRSFEHAGWVLFEDVVLIWSCLVSCRDMRNICEQESQNEELLEGLEHRVRERTHELEQEVAERQRAESSLRASEERFRTLVENAPVGIYRNTPDGQIETANPALVTMLRLQSKDELIARYGGPAASMMNPERLDYFERLQRDEQLKGYESVWHRSDGTPMHVRENARVTRDAEGQIIYYEGTVEDISEHKRAEQELKELNERLVKTSRQAGMAEVATGVLHNVGNVLNSVNVSTTILRSRLQQSRLTHLTKALSLLQGSSEEVAAFLTHDAKGRQLPPFLARLNGHLVEEQKELLRETDSLAQNIEHIKQIVSMQQSLAGTFGVTEALDAEHLVEEAIQFNADSFQRHRIQLVRHYGKVPPILGDRHRMLQILVNLLRNAKHALRDLDRPEKQICLSIMQTGEGRVRIEVRDNGVGIRAEHLSQIFRHGFTTKKDGHGFGLHSGALAAQEMKGSLTAQSAGPGAGANFRLELPAVTVSELAA